MDIQNTLETPAFQGLNQSAILPPASQGATAPLNISDISVAKPDSLAPIEPDKGSLINIHAFIILMANIVLLTAFCKIISSIFESEFFLFKISLCNFQSF